ncbi:hypothetical protein C0995_003926 [Termitomyces sp. Mi166|nr:hypothetical protein C0995_003926 [Termitomyces sp. Mi166\
MSEEPTYAWSNLNFNGDSDAPTLLNLDDLNTFEYLTEGARYYYNAYEEQGTQRGVSEVGDEEVVADWLAPEQIERTFSFEPPEEDIFNLSSSFDQQFPVESAVVGNTREPFGIRNEPVVFPADSQYFLRDIHLFPLPLPMQGNDELTWLENEETRQDTRLPAAPTPLAEYSSIPYEAPVPSGSQYYPEGFLQVPLPPTSGHAAYTSSQNMAIHRSESFEQETSYYHAYSGQGFRGLFNEGQEAHGPVYDTLYEERVADWGPLPLNTTLTPPQIEIRFSSERPQVISDNNQTFNQEASLPAVPTPSNTPNTTSEFGVFQGDVLNCSFDKCTVRISRQEYSNSDDFQMEVHDHLKRHIDTFEKPGDGRWRCKWAGCDQYFRQKRDLERHLRSNSHVSFTFSCEFCPGAWTRKSNRNKHVRLRVCRKTHTKNTLPTDGNAASGSKFRIIIEDGQPTKRRKTK